MEKVHGLAEVVIGKQRHGPTGTVKMAFLPQFTQFSDLAQPADEPEDMY
jgi:replicative DNA helicase